MRIRNRADFLGLDWAVLLSGILCFVLISVGLTRPVVYLVLLAFMVLLAFCGPVKVAFYNLLILMPYAMVFKLSSGSTSLWTYYMLFAAVLVAMRVKRINAKVLTLLLCFVVYTVFGVKGAVTDWIKQIAAVLLLYFFVKTADIEDAKNYTAAYGLGLLGSSIIGLNKVTNPAIVKYFSSLKSEYINGVSTYRFTGLYLDPNYYAVGLVLILFLGILLLVNKKAPKAVFIPMLLALLYFGFLSYSRMFIISVALAVVFFTGYLLKGRKGVGIAVAFAVIIGVMIYFIGTQTTLIDGLLSRFGRADISNNRFNIWSSYMNYIVGTSHVLFLGTGLGSPYYNGVGPHNTFIEVLYFMGVVGSVLYYYLLGIIMTCRREIKRRKMIHYALLLVFLVMISTLGFFKTNDFLFCFMFVWLGMNLDVKLKQGSPQKLYK